ncbi:MAG: hypothetical protein FWE49_02590, partial [Synergistaceae bacterium]|nr:hypothetical protein [Synergistaceae bacterium]
YDFLAWKNKVIQVIDDMADGMDNAIKEQRKSEEEVCALITSSSLEQNTSPDVSISLNAASGEFVQNGRVVRNAQLISYTDGANSGLIGIWCDLSGENWFENKMIYDPVPCLSTESITVEQAVDFLTKSYLADGSWVQFITDVMEMDVEQINEIQMMVLIGVFDGLIQRGNLNGDMGEVEKFIELSYLLEKEILPSGVLSIPDAESFRHNLSPVFLTMAGLMLRKGIFAEAPPESVDDEINRAVFINQLLTAIIGYAASMSAIPPWSSVPQLGPMMGNTQFAGKQKLTVRLTHIEPGDEYDKWPWDYNLSINLSSAGSIDMYQYRPKLNFFSAEHLEDELWSLKMGQISVVATWFMEKGIEKAINAFVKGIPGMAACAEVGHAIYELVDAYKKNDGRNEIADKALALSYYTQLSNAACLGAALTLTSSGGICINEWYVFEVELEEILAEYRVKTGVSLYVQDIIALLEDKDFANNKLRDFARWYDKFYIQVFAVPQKKEL